MSAGRRGGRRAAQPGPEWAAPERLPPGGEAAVRFIEEKCGRERTFDFAATPASRVCGSGWPGRSHAGPARGREPRGSPPPRATSTSTRSFAELLAGWQPRVVDAAGVGAAHVEGFHRRYDGLRSQGTYVDLLRSLLRDDPELAEDTRAALVRTRAKPAEQSGTKEREYTDAEWQQIMTAVRGDVRAARDRIRAGRDLLRRHRAGAVDPASADGGIGALLDVFDRTGDFPRYRGGGLTHEVSAAGGAFALAGRLCLTLHEMTAFALLLVALTGENFGTVAAWPATHYRPDGGLPDEPGVALVEAAKPRRGPEREHMVTPVEDVPAGLAGLLAAPDEESRLLRSPLKVYQLLLELSEVSRRHGRHAGAFSGYTPRPGRFGPRWTSGVEAHHVCRWARHHGFPDAGSAGTAGRPGVDVRRMRQTVLEHRRRPVAHTRRTLDDRYLLPSPRARADGVAVLAAALGEEVAKARAGQAVPVFTAAFAARARADPDGAAAEAGMAVQALQRLLSGEQDTALASCVDHLAGPHADAGQPCPASFLSCLGCPNARALPHHLPVQIAAADRIAALRPHLDPAVWQARYQQPLRRLGDIVDAYTPPSGSTPAAGSPRARGTCSMTSWKDAWTCGEHDQPGSTRHRAAGPAPARGRRHGPARPRPASRHAPGPALPVRRPRVGPAAGAPRRAHRGEQRALAPVPAHPGGGVQDGRPGAAGPPLPARPRRRAGARADGGRHGVAALARPARVRGMDARPGRGAAR